MTLTIDAKNIYYQQLNEILRKEVEAGERHIIINNVRGQRYIGTGLTRKDVVLEINGVPGEDLAFCMGGPTIIVHGHGQNAIANTMDSGTVVIHGLGGDALAYGMRGGKLFIRDKVGYRVGIHMKEYKEYKPAVVVGTTSGDFLGEYMAGGTLIVLNRENDTESVVGQADKTLATGIHGGEIFIFNYEVPSYMPGIGSKLTSATKKDLAHIKALVEEYCSHFGFDPAPLLQRDIVKIMPAGSRPFSKFYYPSYPVHTGLKPEQVDLKSPCEAACPTGIPTGRFLRHIRLGENKKALALIDDYTPFRYSNCGFICPHLCMDGCSRGKVDFPVRTAELALEYRSEQEVQKLPANGKKVAVIGAGPAGLTAAYFLARYGYEINVYEADNHPGGKVYQAVSRRRLPLEDLNQDLERIIGLGVSIHTNTRVDSKRLAEILDNNDHVIVATGAHSPVIPPVKGKELITGGLNFLKAFNRGEKISLAPEIVVIGGGDVAMDGIEALVELGICPENITVIDIQTPAANELERRKWEQAGVNFRYPYFLQEVTQEGVRANNSAGQPHFFSGQTIAFINERPELGYLPEEIQKQLDRRGFFNPDDLTFTTVNPKISIIGDATGAGLVTNNIAKARNCALQLNAKLQGQPYNPVVKETIKLADLHLDWNKPLSADKIPVQEEHQRCLHCGFCVQCDDCIEICPRDARTRNGEEFTVDLSLCGGCGSCAAACKGGVIRMVPR